MTEIDAPSSPDTSKPGIRLIRVEQIPQTGYFEVRFPDGRESVHFSWDDHLGRHIRPGIMTQSVALEKAKTLARAERDALARQG